MFQPGGDIEVEEVVDEVFQESKFEGTEDSSEIDKLMNNGREHRNGSVASAGKASLDDVRIHPKGPEEKMRLTKSQEELGHLEV